MEPVKLSLSRARETKNTVRDEGPESDQPMVISALYVQKGAIQRLDDPEAITVTIARAER
jgi:hypothetical protein